MDVISRFFIDGVFVPGGRFANQTCEKIYLVDRGIAVTKNDRPRGATEFR
jgi:hypothetical protein